MARPARARIHLDAIRHNTQLARTLAPKSRLMAIIKGDAYGHGAVPVARALAEIVDGFGVACIEEARLLREAGIEHRLLLLEGMFTAEELTEIDELRLDVTVHSAYQWQAIEQADLSHPIRVWLKVNTGMNRLGFAPDAIPEWVDRITRSRQVHDLILMTHAAGADALFSTKTQEQLARFQAVAEACPASPATSMANSPSVLGWPETHLDWIRPGMMLYGANSLPETPADNRRPELKPAMSLESAVIAERWIEPGETLGYGERFRAVNRMRVGVVALGYADGYPRNAPNGLPVQIDGHDSQLIGRVSMDMLTVDLSHLPNTGVGSRVEFWGPNVPIETIARQCDTIPYELVSQITARVPRIY